MAEVDLQTLSGGLDYAIEEGHLPDPGARPRPAQLSPNDADSRAYIWALRTRMVALGYLGEKGNRESDRVDRRLVDAIRRFQRDIGDPAVIQDGWAGPVTWRVLQSLTSFEEGQDPESWAIETEFATCPAIARAVWLRLWVMGFFEDWSRSRLKRRTEVSLSQPAFLDAYRRFWGFAQQLGLTTDAFRATLDRAALAVLFDHDGIVSRLGSDRFGSVAGFERQLGAIARIELWLHGYDCQPGAPSKRVHRRRRAGRIVRRSISSLKSAIRAFWRDNDASVDDTASVSRRLFEQLAMDLQAQAPDDAEREAQFDAVARRIDQLNESESATFVERLQDVASTIWDGVRRLARSLWRWLRRVGGAVGSMLKNLARFVARHARRYFHLVVRAVDVVQGGLDYLRDVSIPSRLPSPVVICRGADFDHFMMLAPKASVDGSPAFAAYRRGAARFDAGCIIVGELVQLVRHVGSLAAGVLAGPLFWLRALLAVGRVREFLAEVRAAREVLDSLQVGGAHAGALMRVDVA